MEPEDPNADWIPAWIHVENAKRAQLKAQHGALLLELAAILFEADPIGINFDDNTDEYEAEAGTILPRLRTCRDVDTTRHVVHEEFVRWFGVETAGDEATYNQAAEGIWKAWSRYKRPID